MNSDFQICMTVYYGVGTPGRIKNPRNRRDYSSGVLTVIWDPLPSLDLTGIDPDIVYAVELFKISCGQNVSIGHRVVSGNYARVNHLDLMHIYKAVIAARNNISSATNGLSVEIRG